MAKKLFFQKSRRIETHNYYELFKTLCEGNVFGFKSQTSDMMVRDLGRDSSRTKNHRRLTNTQLTGIIARTPYSTVTFYYFCKLLSHKWLPTKLSEALALIKCSVVLPQKVSGERIGRLVFLA